MSEGKTETFSGIKGLSEFTVYTDIRWGECYRKCFSRKRKEPGRENWDRRGADEWRLQSIPPSSFPVFRVKKIWKRNTGNDSMGVVGEWFGGELKFAKQPVSFEGTCQ